MTLFPWEGHWIADPMNIDTFATTSFMRGDKADAVTAASLKQTKNWGQNVQLSLMPLTSNVLSLIKWRIQMELAQSGHL